MRNSIRVWLLLGTLLIVLPAVAVAGEVPPAASWAATGTLRHGDRGEAVAELQRLLHSSGFDPGKVDGIFGPRTERALRQAQASLGLSVDGLAGKETLAGLQQASAAAATSGGPQEEKPAAGAQGGEVAPGIVIHEATEQATPAVAPVQEGQPGEKGETTAETSKDALALTFNGLSDEGLLPELLNTLRQYDAKATFFVSGEEAERAPQLLARIAADGHEIGNLGYTQLDMTRMSEPTMQAQLLKAQHAIEDAVGKQPAFFRPPQGRFDEALLRAAEGLQLKLVLWTNVTVRDVPDLEASSLAERLAETAFPGAVLMLHPERPASIQATALLLETMRQKGYSGISLSELFR